MNVNTTDGSPLLPTVCGNYKFLANHWLRNLVRCRVSIEFHTGTFTNDCEMPFWRSSRRNSPTQLKRLCLRANAVGKVLPFGIALSSTFTPTRAPTKPYQPATIHNKRNPHSKVACVTVERAQQRAAAGLGRFGRGPGGVRVPRGSAARAPDDVFMWIMHDWSTALYALHVQLSGVASRGGPCRRRSCRRMSVDVGTQLYACMVCFCLSVSRESWIAKLRLRLLRRRLCQGHAESRRQEAPRPVAWHHGPA